MAHRTPRHSPPQLWKARVCWETPQTPFPAQVNSSDRESCCRRPEVARPVRQLSQAFTAEQAVGRPCHVRSSSCRDQARSPVRPDANSATHLSLDTAQARVLDFDLRRDRVPCPTHGGTLSVHHRWSAILPVPECHSQHALQASLGFRSSPFRPGPSDHSVQGGSRPHYQAGQAGCREWLAGPLLAAVRDTSGLWHTLQETREDGSCRSDSEQLGREPADP